MSPSFFDDPPWFPVTLCAPSTDDHPGSRPSSFFTYALPSIVLCNSLSLALGHYPTLAPLSTHSSVVILALAWSPAIHATTLHSLPTPCLVFWFLTLKERRSRLWCCSVPLSMSPYICFLFFFCSFLFYVQTTFWAVPYPGGSILLSLLGLSTILDVFLRSAVCLRVTI